MAVPPEDNSEKTEGVKEADQSEKDSGNISPGEAVDGVLANNDVSAMEEVNSFRELVSEIKERLADLSERETDLRRREDEYSQQQDSLERLASMPDTIDEEARKAAYESAVTTAAEAELERRKAELEQRSAEMDEKRARLKAIADKLEIQRTELEQRQTAVDSDAAEIAESRAEAELLMREAAEARELVEIKRRELDEHERALKERESRQQREIAKLEDERRRIKAESDTLGVERKKLAQLHLEPEELGAEPHRAADTRPAFDAEPVAAIPRGLWRRRGLMLGTLVGLATASLWLAFDQPRFRGVARVQIESVRGAAAREHADGILSDELDNYWPDSLLGERWRAARVEDRIDAHVLPSKTGFEIALNTENPEAAQNLPSAAALAYAAYLAQLPDEHFRSAPEIEWQENRAALQGELQRRRESRDDLRARLTSMPRAAEREEAEAAFDGALEQFEGIAARLRSQQEDVVALESRAAPRGDVPAEAWQRAFDEDPLYQEDLKEFASEARQYRQELAVSMVLAAEPLGAVLEHARAMTTALEEQRDLQPPANVRGVLDQCLAELEDYASFLAEFTQGWRQRRETVERLNVSEQIVELMNQHGEALATVERVVEESRRVLNELHVRVDGLAEAESAGTREMVVVSVLRGDLSRLSEQIGVLAEAAAAINPESNFRLDAHDRQLRGLRTRLLDRKERIRAMLQTEVDQAARTALESRKNDLRSSIRAAENEREALMQKLVDNLGLLRALDEQHQELRRIDAEADAENAAVERLEERLRQLDADKPASGRDKLSVASAQVEQIAGRNRLRDALLAAAGAFVACNLLLLLFGIGATRQYYEATEGAG